MWLIRHETTHKFFIGFQPAPNSANINWTEATSDDVESALEEGPMQFAGLEDEEDYRGLNLPGENAQPFEAP